MRYPKQIDYNYDIVFIINCYIPTFGNLCSLSMNYDEL